MADVITNDLEWNIGIHHALHATVSEGVGAGPMHLDASGADIPISSLGGAPVRDRDVRHLRRDKEGAMRNVGSTETQTLSK